MSLERVMRVVNKLKQPFIYQGEGMGEPVVVMPFSQFEELVDGEGMADFAQPSLPFQSMSFSSGAKPSAPREVQVPLSENRRLLETIAQFSSEPSKDPLEPILEQIVIPDEAIITPQAQRGPVDGLLLEERFYFETVENS